MVSACREEVIKRQKKLMQKSTNKEKGKNVVDEVTRGNICSLIMRAKACLVVNQDLHGFLIPANH